MSSYHTPVMLDESISALVTNPQGIYADATFGGGGHTAAILSRLNDGGRVIAFDRDSDALGNRLDDPRLTLIHNNFRFIENYRAALSGSLDSRLSDGFDGILADLGVSSHQFDTAERGFSFRFDAPLDMRMDNGHGTDAATLVNTLEEKDLEKIFSLYGEIPGARRIASMIVAARKQKPILTTTDLNEAVSRAVPAAAPHKFLAKLYQALRIEVNQEMRSLEKFLDGAARSLKAGGRLVVITYHSLEDRMVKNFIRTGNVDGTVEKDPVFGRVDTPLEPLLKKAATPREEETASNTRARSAKLRVGVKLPHGPAKEREDAR